MAVFSPLLKALATVPAPRRAHRQLYKLPYVLPADCEVSLVANEIDRALVVPQGFARPSGAGLASLGSALRCSATTWLGILPSSTHWQRAL